MSNKRVTNYFPFRAFHNQKASYKTALFFLLPIIFNVLMLFLLPFITDFWGTLYEIFLEKSGLYGVVYHAKYTLLTVGFQVPSLDMSAEEPSTIIYQGMLVISIAIFLLSLLLPTRSTPLTYFLRMFIVILWISFLFFYFFPGKFPYDIEVYTRSGLLQNIAILFAVPWIFAMTYYLFGDTWLKKIFITSLTLLYFIVLAPFQYFLNAVVIHVYSLGFMPVMHLYFGLLINVFACVGFYSYGVSLEGVYPKWVSKNALKN